MTKHTLPSDTLSLLSLRRALIAAEKESPAHPPRQPRDLNEQLAMKLIEKIKHPQRVSFADLNIESPRSLFVPLQEMAGRDAR